MSVMKNLTVSDVDPERNVIPVVTVKEGGIVNGGDLPAFNEAEFATVHKKYRVIHVRLRIFVIRRRDMSQRQPQTVLN